MEKRYLRVVSGHPLVVWQRLVPEKDQDDVDQHVAVQALVGQGLLFLGEGQACIGHYAVVEQRVPALPTGVLAAHFAGQPCLLVVLEAVGAHVVEVGAVAARAAVRGVAGAELAFLGNVVVAPPPAAVLALLVARGGGRGGASDRGRAAAGALLHAPKGCTLRRGRVNEPRYVGRSLGRGCGARARGGVVAEVGEAAGRGRVAEGAEREFIARVQQRVRRLSRGGVVEPACDGRL